MQRVASIAAAAEVARPSPELCLIAGLIIHLTKGKPEKVEVLAEGMRNFVAAHRELSGVMRLRGAEYDAEVRECMEQAALWLDRIEPFLVFMAKR